MHRYRSSITALTKVSHNTTLNLKRNMQPALSYLSRTLRQYLMLQTNHTTIGCHICVKLELALAAQVHWFSLVAVRIKFERSKFLENLGGKSPLTELFLLVPHIAVVMT